MGRSRYPVLENQPHFGTCTIVNWIPIFSKPQLAQIIIDSLKFLLASKRLALYGYVIMENHLHLIADADNLSKEIGNFKSFTYRALIDWLIENKSYHILNLIKSSKPAYKKYQKYQLWQESFHPQAILSEEM